MKEEDRKTLKILNVKTRFLNCLVLKIELSQKIEDLNYQLRRWLLVIPAPGVAVKGPGQGMNVIL